MTRSNKKKDVRSSDLLFRGFLKSMVFLVLIIFVSLLIFLTGSAWPTLKANGIAFFWSRVWDPQNEIFGAFPFIWGTAITSLMALFFAAPISLAAAVMISHLAPRFVASPFRFLVEILASIPSVVYGLWGIFVFVPFLRNSVQPTLQSAAPDFFLFEGPPFGVGFLAAGLVLAIMIVPTITSFCVEVFRAIPNLYREGALALGATGWETLKISVFKPAKPGIAAAFILGLGRAMGETMAVTMVIGNRAEISTALFEPSATMSSVIANEYAEANLGLHLNSLVSLGLGLLILSLVVNSISKLTIKWMTRSWR